MDVAGSAIIDDGEPVKGSCTGGAGKTAITSLSSLSSDSSLLDEEDDDEDEEEDEELLESVS